MRRALKWLLVCGAVVTVGCKRDPGRDNHTQQTTLGVDTVGTGSPATSTSEPASGLTGSSVPAVPPTNFETASAIPVSNSGLTGCVVRAVPGWAEVRCEGQNAGGGKIVSAHVESGASPGAALDVKPAPDGTLTLVLPWLKGQRSHVRFSWSDMTQDLVLAIRGSTFKRLLPTAQAEHCERFAKSGEQILAGIRAKIGPFSPAITPEDVYRFPNLGECQMAGQSAWALSLEKLSASGEKQNREVVATLALNHVDPGGNVASLRYGPLTFAPEGLQLPPLMFFDYDADGEAEVIVRQDILLRSLRSMNKALPNIPAVFTFKHGQVAPYAALGVLPSGGVVAEQLDADGRPDVGDYGPFLAWLPDKCGRGECPKRISGPRFFRRSLADGGFSAPDEQADRVIRNKCERTPKALVVDIRTGSGKRLTAQNVACARVRGDSTDSILAQLNELESEMCDDGQKACPLYLVLAAWARAAPPRTLTLPSGG